MRPQGPPSIPVAPPTPWSASSRSMTPTTSCATVARTRSTSVTCRPPAPRRPSQRSTSRAAVVGAAAPATAARVSGRGKRFGDGWRAQLLFFLGAYAVYNAARWIFVGELEQARTHAQWIIDLEQTVGVAIERSVQSALESYALIGLLNVVYMAAQLVVLPGALTWLYKRSRSIYRGLRNTIIATWLMAIPIYALFPVAPPRLADIGIVDTISAQSGAEVLGRSTIFYNPLAAVPSLHTGFAFATGIALALAFRRPWARMIVLLWGPAVALSVVATGNHFVFDILAGLLVTIVGFLSVRNAGWPPTAGRRSAASSCRIRAVSSGAPLAVSQIERVLKRASGDSGSRRAAATLPAAASTAACTGPFARAPQVRRP